MNKQEISKKFKNLIKIASVTSLFVLTYCTNTQAAVLGDINKDGIINASDANILKWKLVQSQELTSEQKQLADLNGDGKITVTDLSLLKAKFGSQSGSDSEEGEVTLKGIEIASLPTKTRYLYGEEFQQDGLSVMAIYSDGSESDVTGSATLSGFNSKKIGSQIITVSYEGKITSFKVSVGVKMSYMTGDGVMGIKVASMPTKTVYKYGEDLDLTGLRIVKQWLSGNTETVYGYSVTGYNPYKLGKQTLTVTYTGMNERNVIETYTVTFRVEVIDYIEELNVIANKTIYAYGEELDITATALYASGAEEDITNLVTVSGYDSTVIGIQTVSIYYKEILKNGESTEFTGEIEVEVTNNISTFNIILNKTTYAYGEELDFTAEITYADGTIQDVTEEVTTDYDSTITGTQEVTITYTVDGIEYTQTIEVTVAEEDTEIVAVTGVTLDTETATIGIGQILNLVATVEPDNATNKNVTWTSSDSSIVNVDENGEVIGVAEGIATITVTTVEGGFTAVSEITVTSEFVLPTTDGLLKVSNPQNGEGEADGIEPGGDRETSYAWALTTRGNYVYVGTNKNVIGGVVDALVQAMVMQNPSISEDTAWAFVNSMTNNEIPRPTTDVGGDIYKCNITTGEITKIYTAEYGSAFRMAIEHEGDLYFGTYSSTGGNNHILRIDETDTIIPVFTSENEASLRAACIHEGTLLFGGSDSRVEFDEGDEECAQVAIMQKDLTDDIVWNRIADYRDFREYAEDPSLKNTTASPIWDMVSYDGYVWATLPYTYGVVMFRGHQDVDNVNANEYGWIWEEVIGKTNGINNTGMADIPEGHTGDGAGLLTSCTTPVVFNGKLYMFDFDNTIQSEITAISGMLANTTSMGDYLKPMYTTITHAQSLWRYDDATGMFVEIEGFNKYMEGTPNEYVWRAEVYNNELYITTMDSSSIYKYVMQLKGSNFTALTNEEILALADSLDAMGVAFEPYKTMSTKVEELVNLLEESSIMLKEYVEVSSDAEKFKEFVVKYEDTFIQIVNLIDSNLLTDQMKSTLDGILAGSSDTLMTLMEGFDWDGLMMYAYIVRTVENDTWGFDMLKTADGEEFKVVTTSGFGDKYNYGGRSLITTNEGLFIGTANPFYGAQLWRLRGNVEEEQNPEKQIISIEVENLPTITTYVRNGESLDLTGGTIKATYSDGTEISVNMTECEVTGFNIAQEGTQTLTVTYEGQKATFEVTVTEPELLSTEVGILKISNPENGAGEADGLDPDEDRETSYAWAMTTRGDYVYVGTNKNIIGNVLGSFIQAMTAQGLSEDTAWAVVDQITGGEVPRPTTEEGGYIFKCNIYTGEIQKIFVAEKGVAFRMAIENDGDLFFASYAAADIGGTDSTEGVANYLYKVDENDVITQVFESVDGASLRAATIYNDTVLFGGIDARIELTEEEKAAGYVGLAVIQKDKEDDTVWNRIADHKDFIEYANDPALTNSAGSPIWDLCVYKDYVYAVIPGKNGFVMFKGHEAQEGETGNEYGWIWEEVIGRNSANNVGLAPTAEGYTGAQMGCISSAATPFVFKDKLYLFDFDMTITSEVNAAKGLMLKVAGQNPTMSEHLLTMYTTLSHPQSLWCYNDETGLFEEVEEFCNYMDANPCNEYVWRFGTYQDELYITTMDSSVMYRYILRLVGTDFIKMTEEEINTAITELNTYAEQIADTATSDITNKTVEMLNEYLTLDSDSTTFGEFVVKYEDLFIQLESLVNSDARVQEILANVDVSGLKMYALIVREVGRNVEENIMGFDMLKTAEGTNFEVVTNTGFDDPYNYGGRSFITTEEGLFIGTANPFYGAQLWRLRGDEVVTPEPEVVPVTGIELSASIINMDVNGTQQLTATVSPDNATNKNIIWSSSDDSIATVDDNGMITAIGAGETTITVTTKDGGFTANCEVIVEDLPTEVATVTGIEILSEPTKTEYLKDVENLELDGAQITVTYSDSTTTALDVEETMISTFDNTTIGTQTITVTYEGYTTEFDVKVYSVELTLPTKTTYQKGEELDLTGGGLTFNYGEGTEKSMLLSIDMVSGYDSSIVGTQTITVSYGAFVATFEVVVGVVVEEVTLNLGTLTIYAGENYQLTATVSPVDATNQTVEWSSSDDSIVTVDNTGKIIAISSGTATIYATVVDGENEVTASCEVTVPVELATNAGFFRISNPNTNEDTNYVDGIDPQLDKETSYATAMIARDEYLYIGTNRNVLQGMTETYVDSIVALTAGTEEELTEEDAWSIIEVITSYEIENSTSTEAANIYKCNMRTGEVEVIEHPHNYEVGYSSAIEYNNDLYFTTYSLAEGSKNYILKIDENDQITEEYTLDDDTSFRATCEYEDTILFAGTDSNLGLDDSLNYAPLAIIQRDANGQWTNIADYNDFIDYANNEAVLNKIATEVTSPITGMCVYDGYVWVTIPNTNGAVMFKGAPTADGSDWTWEEVIGTKNGNNNIGLATTAEGYTGDDAGLLSIAMRPFTYDGKLYVMDSDNTIEATMNAITGLVLNSTSMGDYLKDMYITLNHTQSLWCYDNNTNKFIEVSSFNDIVDGTVNEYLWNTAEYNGDLYISTMDSGVLYSYILQLIGNNFTILTVEELTDLNTKLGEMITAYTNALDQVEENPGFAAIAGITSEQIPEYRAMVSALENAKVMLTDYIHISLYEYTSVSYYAEDNEYADYKEFTEDQYPELYESYVFGDFVVYYEELINEITALVNDGTFDESSLEDLELVYAGSTETLTTLKEDIDWNGLKMYSYIYRVVGLETIWGFDLIKTVDGMNFETITWDAENNIGMDCGFDDCYNYGGSSLVVTENGLFIGTANPFYGAQLWRYIEKRVSFEELGVEVTIPDVQIVDGVGTMSVSTGNTTSLKFTLPEKYSSASYSCYNSNALVTEVEPLETFGEFEISTIGTGTSTITFIFTLDGQTSKLVLDITVQ